MTELTAAGATHASPSSGIDPRALMRIQNLQLRAKVVVEGFFAGLHRSPYHGFSVEFSEYRPYAPGDDPRYVDWRLYARTDRYYVKRFEEETNLRCHVILDTSRSMGYGSHGISKSEYARTVAATLAYFLAQQRDAVGLVTFDDRIGEFIPARFRPGHMHRLMIALQRSLAGKSTELALPLEQVARTVRRRGLITLISDLLAPLDSLETNLGYLRSRGHEVIVLRVLDPAELDFRLSDPAIYRDLETQRQIYVDPSAARETYLARFQEHAARVEAACNDLGIDHYLLTTDQPLELALFDFLHARSRRGRRPGRMARQAALSRAPGAGGAG